MGNSTSQHPRQVRGQSQGEKAGGESQSAEAVSNCASLLFCTNFGVAKRATGLTSRLPLGLSRPLFTCFVLRNDLRSYLPPKLSATVMASRPPAFPAWLRSDACHPCDAPAWT